MNGRYKGLTPEQIAERRKKKKLQAAVMPPRVGRPGTNVFHCPLTPCNFSSWLRFDSLPVHQACFVMLGFEPPPLELLMSREVAIDKPPLYFDLLGSLKVSIANGSVPSSLVVDGAYKTTHATLTDLVSWANAKSFPINAALIHLIQIPQTHAVSVEVQKSSTPVEFKATTQKTAAPAPVDPVDDVSNAPAPLTTSEIAGCFAELHNWTFEKWRDNLQSPAKWLMDCRKDAGGQGKPYRQSTWLPVKIAMALVKKDPDQRKSIRARFKKMDSLKPWLETMETYIPDNRES